MASSALEDLFTACVLDVSVPAASISYPPQDAESWLGALKDPQNERKQAFFDEHLVAYLTLQIPWASPELVPSPPRDLVVLLTRLQVLLEGSYISQVGQSDPPPQQSAFLSAPPRTSSKLNLGAGHHPSIFPPSTPNPTPSSVDSDQRYARSEGTVYTTRIWGQETASEILDRLDLFYSSERQEWLAIYRMALTVAFIPLPISDPLLCLTVSTTLRQSPLVSSRPNDPLRTFLASVGADDLSGNSTTPQTASSMSGANEQSGLNGFEEVNLLSGLAAGPSFARPDELDVSLASTRLGPATRQELFSLSSKAVALNPPTSSSPISPTRPASAAHTLRKAFRKTLTTASGFRVRMRTTFVPPLLNSQGDESMNHQNEASNEERTVVLCIEIENADETYTAAGFSVDSVQVTVSGEGATASLISSTDEADAATLEEKTFPLLLHPHAQYNLLYAVSFIQSESESALQDLSSTDQSLRRAVVIDIKGRPFTTQSFSSSEFFYPTSAFSSRWNCVLDLSSQQTPSNPNDTIDGSHFSSAYSNTFPEPASPFPGVNPRLSSPLSPKTLEPPQASRLTAGSKRHTIAGSGPSALKKSAITNYRSSASALHRRDSGRGTPPPLPTGIGPNVTFTSPTDPPRTPLPLSPPAASTPEFNSYFMGADQPMTPSIPTTPAYPAFSAQQSNWPPSPMSQSPATSYQKIGQLGPVVDIRRERGMTGQGMVPPTPGPFVTPGFPGFDHQFDIHEPKSGESVVVSIGMTHDSGPPEKRLKPFDHFSIDIFVYNQSTSTKRFQVSYPIKRRGITSQSVGILPLDNRVRIGPLLPSACQSVRLQFVALLPGVHSIETLTFTDVESGTATNLRSVLDVVVHDTREGPSPS